MHFTGLLPVVSTQVTQNRVRNVRFNLTYFPFRKKERSKVVLTHKQPSISAVTVYSV